MNMIVEYVKSVYFVTVMMAPWLLFGFIMAGVLSRIFSPEMVKRHLGGVGFWPIFKSALFGVPLPLCSCGVIPVAVALRSEGASRGATGAFIISTPQTGIDSFLVTGSILGWAMACVRVILAFCSGLVGGLLIDLFGEKDEVKSEKAEESKCCCGKKKEEPAHSCCCESEKKEESKSCCCESEKKEEPKSCCCGAEKKEEPVHSCCCGAEKKAEKSQNGFVTWITGVFSYGLGKMLTRVSDSLIIGIAIAALIEMALPENVDAVFFRNNIVLEYIAMVLIGIPLYVCSTASVPVAASMIFKGISPGAVLVFLVVGPATNGATITSMLKITGKKSTAIYLGTVAVLAVITGVALDLCGFKVLVEALQSSCEAHNVIPVWKHIAAWILIVLAFWSLYKKKFMNKKKA